MLKMKTRIETEQSKNLKNEGFSKFCNETSMPGWSYLNHEMSQMWKVLWIIFLIIVIMLSGYVFVATTVTTIDSTMASLKDVVFPTLYICNINQLSKSFLEPFKIKDDPAKMKILLEEFISGSQQDENTVMQKTQKEIEMLQEIYQTLNNSYEWEETKYFGQMAGQNCSDMLVNVNHPGSKTTRKFYSAYKIVTDFGICCFISPFLNFVYEKTRDLDPTEYLDESWLVQPKGSQNGEIGGLEVLLDVEKFEFTYGGKDSQGFRIAFVDQRDKPMIIQDGYLISTGNNILASLAPMIVNTSDRVISRFSPDVRGCYNDQEFHLRCLNLGSGYRYSMKNCLYSSLLEKVLSNCSCVPDFYGLPDNNSANLTSCRNVGLTCSELWLEKLGNDELSQAFDTNNQLQKCLPRCERQSETTTFTFSKFPIQSAFPQHPDLCLTLYKVARICSNPSRAKVFEESPDHKGTTCREILNANNSLKLCTEKGVPIASTITSNPKMTHFLFNYAENNFAALKVFIKDPYYTLIRCDEQMPLITFLGSTGGLLGLCLGFSLVSIFEIFFHVIIFFTG